MYVCRSTCIVYKRTFIHPPIHTCALHGRKPQALCTEIEAVVAGAKERPAAPLLLLGSVVRHTAQTYTRIHACSNFPPSHFPQFQRPRFHLLGLPLPRRLRAEPPLLPGQPGQRPRPFVDLGHRRGACVSAYQRPCYVDLPCALAVLSCLVPTAAHTARPQPTNTHTPTQTPTHPHIHTSTHPKQVFQGVVFFRAPDKQPLLVQSVALFICLFVTQVLCMCMCGVAQGERERHNAEKYGRSSVVRRLIHSFASFNFQSSIPGPPTSHLSIH